MVAYILFAALMAGFFYCCHEILDERYNCPAFCLDCKTNAIVNGNKYFDNPSCNNCGSYRLAPAASPVAIQFKNEQLNVVKQLDKA